MTNAPLNTPTTPAARSRLGNTGILLVLSVEVDLAPRTRPVAGSAMWHNPATGSSTSDTRQRWRGIAARVTGLEAERGLLSRLDRAVVAQARGGDSGARCADGGVPCVRDRLVAAERP